MQNMETKTVSETKVLNKKYAGIYADIPWEDEAWPFERIIALPVGPAVSPPSPGLCGWRRGLRSAIPSKPDLRRRSVGRLRDDPDGFGDVDGRERPIGLAAYRKAAHLAFDAARIASAATGGDQFVQDFVERQITVFEDYI